MIAIGQKIHIFILGDDPYNREFLESINTDGRYVFHTLLTRDEARGATDIPVGEHLEKARGILSAHDGLVDGIVTFWDYPFTLLQTLLCREFDIPLTPPESVFACEHKYWSRLEQSEVVPDCVPEFRRVDPFDDKTVAGLDLEYPFWLKPIKSFRSHLGFKITNDKQLASALEIIRAEIEHFSRPFNHLLQFVDVPAKVTEAGKGFCIAESIISGKQCTVEGYAFDGDIHIHGIVDSFRYPNRSSFYRYQYPSKLPVRVRERLISTTCRLMRHIGFTRSPFNVEYFYDRERDTVKILEINPRISQSHSDIFRRVDGISNHRIALDLAEGKKPEWEHGGGEWKCAAKFFLRYFNDGFVRRVPSQRDIDQVRARYPYADCRVKVPEHTWLHDLSYQESYSYTCATLFLGADDTTSLIKKYDDCAAMLPFEIIPYFAGKEQS